jgi:F-type H+-transporting ATPase subunit delta
VTRRTSALARRYARALLAVVDAKGKAAALELKEELRGFAALVQSHEALRRLLAQPAVGAEAKRKVVMALAQRAEVSPLVLKLVELLASRDRLALVGEVAAAYAGLANVAHGVVSAEVVSAAPLQPAQQQALVAALAVGTGNVELTSEVEPALVGGLVVRVGGCTYDGSVRTRLVALRRRLAASS